MYGTKLQKWEQITTLYIFSYIKIMLWCMVQSYKNESKSQQLLQLPVIMVAVMYGTKLQKWEQITTPLPTQQYVSMLWCMVQSYKNESKSQLECLSISRKISCDVWYKVTKMRANHNRCFGVCFPAGAVMYGTKLQKWEQITT